MTLGKFIAKGKGRKVYQHPNDPDLIIKVPINSDKANRWEWEFWNLIKDTEYAKYFCPCVEFTDGNLIMKRCKPGKRVPQGLTIKGIKIKDSTKSTNYGRLGKRNVLLDYSHAYKQLKDLL